MTTTAKFWYFFISSTLTAMISVYLTAGRVLTQRIPHETRLLSAPSHMLVLNSKTITAIISLTLFWACNSVMILAYEDFAYRDNSLYILSTLRDLDISPPIWPDAGRFFPLAHQEFNLVRHFTHTALGYQLLPIGQILIISYSLLAIDSEINILARTGLVVLALISPSILISFSGLVFIERNVLFWLTLLLLSVRRFEQARSVAWAVAAAVFGQMMIYSKEPAFLLLLGFAAGRLLLRGLLKRCAGRNHDRLWDIEGRLDWCLVSQCVLYVIVYWYAILRKSTELGYAVSHMSFLQVINSYIQFDLLAWIFLTFFSIRVCMIVCGRKSPVPFWDGLALGGVAYFLFYQISRMYDRYFLAPVDLIAIMYVGRFTILPWKYLAMWSKVVAFLVVLIVLVQEVVLSCLATLERKNIIQGKSAIAAAVEAQFRSGKRTRLFFPFADLYEIREFGAYLSYRGLPIEGVDTGSTGRDSVVLGTNAVSNDGPCFSYEPIRCHAVRGPVSGDLIIVLPDDYASVAETSQYREGGEQLFSYQPRPYVPPGLYSILGYNRWSLESKALPDRWLQGSVMVWK